MWTILNSMGLPVIRFTSIIDVDIKDAGKVTQYPVEEGGLAAYNKTDTPLDVYINVAVEGSDPELSTALDTLAMLKSSIELVSLVTPEKEYENLNLETFSYSRKREDGLGVIYFELHLIEIPQVTPRYTNAIALPQAKNKESATTVDTGKKQTSLFKDIKDKFSSGA